MDIAFEIILAFSIFVIALVFRYIPHARFYFPATSDTFFFLNKIKNPAYRDEEVMYPKLFTQLLRILIPRDRLNDGRTINRISISLDLITAVFVYLSIRNILGSEIALLSTLLFLVTPFVVKQGSTLSVRSFGLMLVSASLLCLTFPLPWNWIAVIPMSMTFLSHRLSTQTLIFISLTLVILDIQIPLIFITSFFLAIIVSKGEYVSILRAHASTIRRYWTHGHYPNDRTIVVLSTPISIGFLFYFALFVLQSVTTTSLIVFGYTIPVLPSIDQYFESLMLIWGLVCFILVIIWVAGESYKHLPIATVPFAVLTSLLAFTDVLFLILVISLVVASMIQTLYFQLRFDHIDKEFIQLLVDAKDLERDSRILVPHGFDRAAEFFADCKATPIFFEVWTEEEFKERVMNEDPFFALVTIDSPEWFSDWKKVKTSGKWILFTKP